MRTRVGAEETIQGTEEYTVHARISIKDEDGDFVVYSDLDDQDWVTDVSYENNLDALYDTAQVSLKLDDFLVSLAPRALTSKINLADGTYGQRLDVYREMKIETATVPTGTPYADVAAWQLVFHGYVTHVAIGFNASQGRVTLQCGDLGAALARIRLETNGKPDGSPYFTTATNGVGGQDAEDFIQEVLDDWGGGVVLWTPTPSGWSIPVSATDGDTERESPPGIQGTVMEVINQVATQIGWVVRYQWDSASSTFRLKFFAPDRTATVPGDTIEVAQMLDVARFDTTDEGICNRVEVFYYENGPSDPRLARTSAEDLTSQAAYGVRYGCIREDKTSQIDEATEAQDLADAVILDCSVPTEDGEVLTRYRYHHEVYDLITLAGPTRGWSSSIDVGITRLLHRIGAGKATTTIAFRADAPAGRSITWWSRIPGLVRDSVPIGPTGYTLTATAIYGGAVLKVTNAPFSSRLLGIEFHVSTTNGFTPDATSLKARVYSDRYEVTDLTPGTTYYAKAILIRLGGTASTSDQATFVAAGVLGPFAGIGVLGHLGATGLLDNLTSITTRVIDSLTDGVYARTLAAALSSGKVNLAAGSAGFANKLPALQMNVSYIPMLMADPDFRIESSELTWDGFSLMFNGISYDIEGGSAGTDFYAWFNPAASESALQTGAAAPSPDPGIVAMVKADADLTVIEKFYFAPWAQF